MMRTQLVRPRRDPVRATPGDAVEIRPARVDDEERVRRFLEGLSNRTQVQRFFTVLSRPSTSLVRALLAVDERRDALLAVHGEAVVGHAMSFKGSGTDLEIAVVVADEWQGRGLGSRLVRELLRRAEGAGARTLGMEVLGDNRRVLAMVRRAWPEATMKASGGSVEVVATMDPLPGPGRPGDWGVMISLAHGVSGVFAE
ncbi:GNAT family N-acetyltransferase [Streptosporangium sp. NPDC000396]|uniref:GNAT family N-acetyltransferase n=1 Tax=Streptosporangium sp. NPDC000396 TaxID=3366185 RepID=UPI0036A723FD